MAMATIGYDMERITAQNIYLIVSIIQKPLFSFLFFYLEILYFFRLTMAPSGTIASHNPKNARFSVAPKLTCYSFFIKKRSPSNLNLFFNTNGGKALREGSRRSPQKN